MNLLQDAAFADTEDGVSTLRILVQPRRATRVSPREYDAEIVTFPHRVLAVTGGRPGVGATTIARGLAAEASSRGISVAHLDAASAHRAVDRGTDFYLLDIGSSTIFGALADYLILVAAPDAEAVSGAYAALRRHRSADPELRAGLIVNRAPSPGEGAAVAERMVSVAAAFVSGPEVEVLGWVLEDSAARSAVPGGAPAVACGSGSAASAGIRMCVRRLWYAWRPRWSARAA